MPGLVGLKLSHPVKADPAATGGWFAHTQSLAGLFSVLVTSKSLHLVFRKSISDADTPIWHSARHMLNRDELAPLNE
jgi:hypothetical protein